MWQYTHKESAFTLVEILVSIAILIIILAMTISGFRNFARFQQYDQAVSDVLFTLNQARLSARSAVGDESHGVKLAPNSITRFVGGTYNAADPDNIVSRYDLVTISYVLNTAGDEILFEKLTGLPSATGTIMVTRTGYPQSTTIEVSSAGVIQ
jgi:type II secretory pathway pseudopilin PulG